MLEYNIYKIWKTQNDNTINQLEHNETVIKSKYENMKITGTACEVYSCSWVARSHGLFPVEMGAKPPAPT